MKRLLLLFFLTGPSLFAGNPVLPRVPDALEGADIAIMAVNSDGEVIVSQNAERLMLPASNMKLVTTGTALHRLGSSYRFKTSLATCGTLEGNTLKGDVCIIGGADPTLGSIDTIATPVQNVFAQWKKALNDAGIRHISGNVVTDASYIDGMREHPSWQWEDVGTYYGTGLSGLSYSENYFKIKVQPGQKVGDSLILSPVFPYAAGLKVKYDCLTGEKGTGDRLYLYTSDFSDTAILRGTFALGKNAKSIKCSNKFPEYTCASEFSKYLSGCSLDNGGPSRSKPCASPSKIVCRSESPELVKIARSCNFESNNFYADTFFRVLGKEVTGSACWDSSATAVCRVMEELGVNIGPAGIVDGSGLSRKNHISPGMMCRFLGAMMDSPVYGDFLSTIPTVGLDGTVKNCLPRLSPQVRNSVRMKSGSMEGVLCYSGYYTPADGKTIIFSLMVNDSTAPESLLWQWCNEAVTAIVNSVRTTSE